MSIRSSDIVWVAGSYLPGQWNDFMIFRHGLECMLEPGEQIEAGNGYGAEECPARCKVPSAVSSCQDQRKMRGRLRIQSMSG
jgi:hypothetical protein